MDASILRVFGRFWIDPKFNGLVSIFLAAIHGRLKLSRVLLKICMKEVNLNGDLGNGMPSVPDRLRYEILNVLRR
ncbi:hypothetical protein TWF730_007485 [Orbilia blumenaviensis]|uniref:Uncharacterized protein n=1 Tax=Orbilia blumenaviensis TaxID=1796055 RepID=A0AAV9V7V9_9PEZI